MKAAESNSENDLIRLGVGYGCIVCFIIFILALLSIFMSIWTIFGLVWAFGPWNTVQYIDPNQATYCHPTLYRFNYWLFILPLILGPVIFCLPFCIACCAFCAMRDKGTPVSTTEV
jgi:hypothetical protein